MSPKSVNVTVKGKFKVIKLTIPLQKSVSLAYFHPNLKLLVMLGKQDFLLRKVEVMHHLVLVIMPPIKPLLTFQL